MLGTLPLSVNSGKAESLGIASRTGRRGDSTECMGTMVTSIAIANRNATVAQALSLLLGREDEFAVIAEMTERDQIIEVVADAKPELLLVDPALPNVDLVGLASRLADVSPNTAVVVLADLPDARFLKRAVESGARAYLSLQGDADDLIQELKLVARGHVVVTGPAAKDISDLAGPSSSGLSDGLSGREVEVVNLVARGETNREIAETLVIAENTVKVHLRNIYGKLNLRNRQELTAYVLRADSDQMTASG